MTTPVYEQYEAIQYNGTNGQGIADLILNGQVQSDDGALLIIHDGSSDFCIYLNDWVILGRGSGTWLGDNAFRVTMTRNPTQFATQWNAV